MVIALENFLGNILQLMCFSVYFDSILNEKWLFSYRHNDISCSHAMGHAPQRENLEKICNLVRLGVCFDRILH